MVQVVASHSPVVDQAIGAFKETTEGIPLCQQSAMTVSHRSPAMHDGTQKMQESLCNGTELAKLLCVNQKINNQEQMDTRHQINEKLQKISGALNLGYTDTPSYQTSELQHTPILAQSDGHQMNKTFMVSKQSYPSSVTCTSTLLPTGPQMKSVHPTHHNMNAEISDVNRSLGHGTHRNVNQEEEEVQGVETDRCMESSTSGAVETSPYERLSSQPALSMYSS